MSGNSSSQGASGMNAPYLPGYATKWDDARGEWVLTKPRHPDLRGHDQTEIDQAHDRYVAGLANGILAMNHYAAQNGMTPPPRDWTPPPTP